MKNFFPVFKFHLKEGFKSKSFIITAIIIFAIVIGFFAFFHFFNDEEKYEVLLINHTENYKLDSKVLNSKYETINFVIGDESKLDGGRKQLKEGELDAVFIVEENESGPAVDYYYKRFPDSELIMLLQSEVQAIHIANLGEENNISESVMLDLLTPIQVNGIVLEENESMGIIYFFSYVIFIFIIMYGQMVAMGVVGEKTTRVMEIMITKVHPITMMYAKVFSSLLVGLTQIIVVFSAYITAKLLGWTGSGDLNIFGMPLDLSALTLENILFLIVYFVLGYVLYAMLFASISSVVSRAEDISSVLFPVSMLILIGFFLTLRAMFDPNNIFVIIGSYVPFFSPVVMPSLLLSGESNLLQVLGTVGILLTTIFILSYFANRIYLNGVMNYKNKVTFKDVLKMTKIK